MPKKILINEIQISGLSDESQEFVELYNPNNVDVDLTDWYLQRKTKTGTDYSSYTPASLFSEKTIKAKEYFLIARQGSNFIDIADIVTTYTLGNFTEEGGSTLVLKRPDKSISDKVGFGNASDYETAPTANPPKGKSIERKRIGGDTDNNLADFRISDNPTPGTGFMQAGIEDATDYLNNIGVSNGAPFYNLLLQWSSPVSDLDFFQVQYKLNNGEWKNWKEHTSDNSGEFIAYYSLLNGENIYSFRVRAQDMQGNQSDWKQVDVDLSGDVLISEVAFYGTTADSNDQWIELYNRTDKDIDMSGWQVIFGSSAIKLSGMIHSKEYFILEKDNDNNISDILANQIFTGGLIEGGIRLFNSKNRFIDGIIKDSRWAQENFIKDGNIYSIERVSNYSFGSEYNNWKINNGTIINGKDRSENLIYGTPGSQNSNHQLYTFLPSGFGENVQLIKAFSPYIMPRFAVVFAESELIIDPGVVTKFYDNNSGLTVEGTLKAIGTSDEPIIFTSFNDDEYLGDTNGDGNLTSGNPGNWLGLRFTEASKNSDLQNIFVRYAGAFMGFSPATWGSAVWVENSIISLEDSVLENNNNIALNLVNSNSIIDNVNFINTEGENEAVFVQAGSPVIRNSYFEENNYGIYVSRWYDKNDTEIRATPIIENNNFQKNKAPVFMGTYCYPIFSGNQSSENEFNAIIFYPTPIKENTELSRDLPYLIRGAITVPEGLTLTINPGVIVNFENNWAGIIVEGTLKAIGTSDVPIAFRPYYYDQEWIKPGNWLGLHFSKTSQNSELESVDVSYAGACYGNCMSQFFMSAVKVDQSNISFKNSIIRDSANNGMWLVNSSSVIDGVKFIRNNEATPGQEPIVVRIEGGSPEIKNCIFEENNHDELIVTGPWTNPDTGEIVDSTANLHKEDDDPEKNTFIFP